jgi:hypothetical protein
VASPLDPDEAVDDDSVARYPREPPPLHFERRIRCGGVYSASNDRVPEGSLYASPTNSRRTTSGTSSLPIPRPSKSSSMVTRDPAFSPRGSTVYFMVSLTVMVSLTGPPAPRAAQLLGGLGSVIFEVVPVRTIPAIRRVVVYLVPTPDGPSPPCALPPHRPATPQTAWGR